MEAHLRDLVRRGERRLGRGRRRDGSHDRADPLDARLGEGRHRPGALIRGREDRAARAASADAAPDRGRDPTLRHVRGECDRRHRVPLASSRAASATRVV